MGWVVAGQGRERRGAVRCRCRAELVGVRPRRLHEAPDVAIGPGSIADSGSDPLSRKAVALQDGPHVGSGTGGSWSGKTLKLRSSYL